MEVSTNMNMLATPIQAEHDSLSLSEFDSLVTNPTAPFFEIPQTDSLHSRWWTSSPTPQQTSAQPVHSTAHSLSTPSLNNPQTVILLTNNSTTTQQIITPIQSHSNTSLMPQSIIAPSLTTHTSCTISYTLPPTNLLHPQSPVFIARYQRSPLAITHPRYVCQFINDCHSHKIPLKSLLRHITRMKNSINSAFLPTSVLTTIPQTYPHAIPHNLTITQHKYTCEKNLTNFKSVPLTP